MKKTHASEHKPEESQVRNIFLQANYFIIAHFKALCSF